MQCEHTHQHAINMHGMLIVGDFFLDIRGNAYSVRLMKRCGSRGWGVIYGGVGTKDMIDDKSYIEEWERRI